MACGFTARLGRELPRRATAAALSRWRAVPGRRDDGYSAPSSPLALFDCDDYSKYTALTPQPPLPTTGRGGDAAAALPPRWGRTSREWRAPPRPGSPLPVVGRRVGGEGKT